MQEVNEELLRSNAKLGIVLADNGLEGTKLETILKLRKLIEPYIINPVKDELAMSLAINSIMHPERAVDNMVFLTKALGLTPDEYTGKHVRNVHPLSQLTILNKSDYTGSHEKKGIYFNVVCSCGNRICVDKQKLVSGHSRSCVSARSVHGLNSSNLDPVVSSTHNSYKTMVERCVNPNYPDYPKWGGRGIRVCDRWLPTQDDKYIGLLHFIEDMGIKPFMGTSIDRINNDGNYELNNCRWATREQQGSNTNTNVTVMLYGEPYTLTNAAKELGVTRDYLNGYITKAKMGNGHITPEGYLYLDAEDVLIKRNKIGTAKVYNTSRGKLTVKEISDIILKEHGKPIPMRTLYNRLDTASRTGVYDKVFDPPSEGYKVYTINGITKNATEWARHYKMSPDTLIGRLNRGMTIEEAIATPIKAPELYTINGVSKNVIEWCKEYGISESTVRGRIIEGWDPIKAITTPKSKPMTATFQGVERTLSEWSRLLGKHSASRDTMGDRYSRGLRDRDVIRPDTKRSRSTGMLPQVVSINGKEVTVYHDIIHCCEVSGMKIEDVIEGLNKEDSNVKYMEKYQEDVKV